MSIPGGLLGPLGGLEQLMFTTAEPMSKPSRQVKRQAIGGRETVLIRPRQARSWACEIAHDAPQEGHIIDQLESYWIETKRPLIWYPADALGTNMLDPDASLMRPSRWKNMIPNGARVLPLEHETPRFLASGACRLGGLWTHLENIPVPHERTVTVSAVVSAYEGEIAHFWVDELALDGRTIRVHKQDDITGVLERRALTLTTGPDTVAVTLGFSRCNTIAAPAVTLTGRLMPWGVGRGCTSATVEVTERVPLWTATDQHIYNAADASKFTITEVMP